MPPLTQSHTVPLNPPGATPSLTQAQLWAALVLKARQPEIFLRPVRSSRILEEDSGRGVLTREVLFRDGMGIGIGDRMVENVEFKAPWKVDFHNQDPRGPFVSNLISRGDGGELFLTFYIEGLAGGVGGEGGGEGDGEEEEGLGRLAQESVRDCVDVARRLVAEGRITI